MYSESHKRSVAKAITWRLLGTVTTATLVFIFTRKVVLSLAVGGLEFISKIGLFWLHERAWDRVRFGRRAPDAAVLWFTGLSGSGKSTIGKAVGQNLERRGYKVEYLDGDTIRDIFPETGFSRPERIAHVRRVGFVASTLEKHGVFVVASLVSPHQEARQFVRGLCRNFIEIHVATSLEECERRDPKGLYARARRGEISGFTGIDDPYEAPASPELALDTGSLSVDEAAAAVLRQLDRGKRRRNGAPARAGSPKRVHTSGSFRQLQAAGDAVVDRKG